jgi:hypothetical protein
MILPILFMFIVVLVGAVLFKFANLRTSKVLYKQLSTYFFGIAVLLIIVMVLIVFLL